MISNTPSGLYCKKGDFYIDPIKPVKTAIITHAHADHTDGECLTILRHQILVK